MYSLPDDIVQHIGNYLYPRDKICLRLVTKWMSDIIKIPYKVDDEHQNITYSTSNIYKRKRCHVCGVLFEKSVDSNLCQCKTYPNYLPPLEWLQKTYTTSRGYSLLSYYDLECTKDSCSCESRKIDNLSVSGVYFLHERRCPIYRLETDYGVVVFDSGVYEGKKILFTDCVVYRPLISIDRWMKLPEVLQTSTHYWIVLNYSYAIIPIRRITDYKPFSE